MICVDCMATTTESGYCVMCGKYNKEDEVTDVRDRMREANEAVSEATKVLTAAEAEYARLAILDLVDKHKDLGIEAIGYSVESEYNDEGGYYLVANYDFETRNEEDDSYDAKFDVFKDDLWDAGVLVRALATIADPPAGDSSDYRESEGTISINRLREVTF